MKGDRRVHARDVGIILLGGFVLLGIVLAAISHFATAKGIKFAQEASRTVGPPPLSIEGVAVLGVVILCYLGYLNYRESPDGSETE